MGQLFLMDDNNISQEKLLSQISRKFISSARNKREKIFWLKNGSCKKAKSGSGKKPIKNIQNVGVSELPSLKSRYTVKEISPPSCSKACRSEKHLGFKDIVHFKRMNGQLKKLQGGRSEMIVSFGKDSSPTQTGKTRRKRRKVGVNEDEANDPPPKMKRPCEILKEKLKQSMSVGGQLRSSSSGTNAVISERVDGDDFARFSASPCKVLAASCNQTSAARSGKIFSPPEAVVDIVDLHCQQESDGNFNSNRVSILKSGVSTLQKTYSCFHPRMKLTKKDTDSMAKRKLKAVVGTAISSTCESSKTLNICDDSGNCGGQSECVRQILNPCESRVYESRTTRSELDRLDNDSSFSLGRIFDSECITPANFDGPKTESSQEVCSCADKSVKLPAVHDIPDWMYVAMDCEMVGVGPNGKQSVLARCSIIDYDGNVIYDKYIRPAEVITDYRTPWSGIRPVHMKTAVPIHLAVKDIKECLAHKVVIGHAVYHDFKVIGVVPDHHFVRDTAMCKELVDMANLQGKGNSLKKLSEALLDRKIQTSKSGHCSVEDAQATLDLFKLVRHSWEPVLYSQWSKKTANIVSKVASFVETSTRLRNSEDFLNDEFWPSDME